MLVRAAQRSPSKQVSKIAHQRSSCTRLNSLYLSNTSILRNRQFSSTTTCWTPLPSQLSVKKLEVRDLPSAATERQYNTATTSIDATTDAGYLDFLQQFTKKSPTKVPSNVKARITRTPSSPAHERSSLVILETPELAIHEVSGIRRNHDPYKLGLAQRKEDVMTTFMACTKIGQVERAEIMLGRLMQLYNESHDKETEFVSAPTAKDLTPPQDKSLEKAPETASSVASVDAEDLLRAHNEFISTWLSRCRTASEETRVEGLTKIAKWWELSMVKENNMSGNARTFAILLETASLDDTLKSQWAMRKYVSYWKTNNLGFLGDVFQEDVLSKDALIQIIKVCNIQEIDVYPDQIELLHEYQREGLDPRLNVIQVNPTEVKGHGLQAVKQSLRSFTDPDFIPTSSPFDTPEDIASFNERRQKLLEEDAYESAVQRWKAEFDIMQESGVHSLNPVIKPMLWQWHQAMIPLIEEELGRINHAEKHPARYVERCLYGPFLRVLPPEKLAAVTIMTLIRNISTDVAEGMKTARGVSAVGKSIEYEHLAEELQKREDAAAKAGMKSDRYQLKELKTERELMVYMKRKQLLASSDDARQEVLLQGQWTAEVRAKVGSVLVSMLIHCAKIRVKTEVQGSSKPLMAQHPAFFHTYMYRMGKRVGVIKVHSDLMELLSREKLSGALISKQLPMLVEPLPWVAWNDGAYYFSPSQVLRTKDSIEQAMYCKEASTRGDLKDLFAGLDVLGSTSWVVNHRVFQVVLQVWNSGEAFADISASVAKESAEPLPDPPPIQDMTARIKWVQEVRAKATERQNNHSERCNVNFKMEIARAFYHEKFYFPHNVDFRGRAYPIPPHLNHMGNDLNRGLLKFGIAKSLGENGLKWLKVHLANVCGFDKASLSDREAYTMAHLEEIYDSARKPLDGNKWWLKSEDPWQTLAACMEVEAALSSPDPTAFECNLAVHQDGTCNGLQHYAALGGDMAGAKEVNLEPSDKPQDVYTGVAELVKESMKKDIEAGVREAIKLEGHITRKVVKQTVMTNVYGVTFIGAKKQVKARLKEIDAIDKDDLPALSQYLTKKIFQSLNTMFTGAHDIQTWFGECARRITRSIGPQQFRGLHVHFDGSIPEKNKKNHLKARGKVEFMSSVIWTTPLGLPVVQPYREYAKVVVKTNLQNISIHDPSIIKEVNSRKQMAAFPPNFIHSLDASHMILCALRCKEVGLQFAAVHDSFWTHPSDVEMMNKLLRDAFIKLHSQDIVNNLKAEFETRYTGYKTLFSMKDREPVAKQILLLRRSLLKKHNDNLPPNAKKKYSFTAVEELDMELRRDRYLRSEDPEERAFGAAMITPGSLVKEYGYSLNQDSEQVTSSSLGDAAFGTIESEERKFEVKDKENEEVMGSSQEIPKVASTIVIEEPAVSKVDTGEEALADDNDVDDDKDPVERSAKDEDALGDDMMGDDVDGEVVDDEDMEHGEAPIEKKTKTKSTGGRLVVAWVDLDFPEVPAKGEFDVARLSKSQYFFS